MATLLNANGQPVATKMHAIQIDIPVPDEDVVTIGAINWAALMAAGAQLLFAVISKNPTAIAAALQAIMMALLGA